MIYEQENMIELLQERWNRLMDSLSPGRWAYPSINHIIDTYTHPDRKYHNLKHIHNMLMLFDDVSHLIQNPLSMELAIFYHDFVYNPRARDNEKQSVKAMIPILGDILGYSRLGDVKALISATSHHQGVIHKGDSRYIVDLDLAILGAEPELYKTYADGIRSEYSHVDSQIYHHGRRSFLLQMLDMDHIYNTQVMRQRFEKQAVHNISSEIKELRNENS